MDDDYERVLCVKPEVFVYKIPPRTTTRGYRASEWKLDQPDWTGRMRIVQVGGKCIMKFEDKISGELFAQAPIPDYPGVTIEPVLDSSRYFVVKIQDDNGRHAFIGMGFADRGDSFDMNVVLQDHFKREKLSSQPAKDDGPKLDLGFKEGQTIKINIGHKSPSETKHRPKPAGNAGIGILPPPPGTKTPILAPPPGSSPQSQSQFSPFQNQTGTVQTAKDGQDDWGEFSSASTSASSGNSWVTF